MKKIILCFLIAVMLCSCSKSINKEETINNINIDGNGEYTTDSGISVKIDKFYYKDNSSTVNLLIKNNNNYDIYIGKYDVMVYDKNNKLIGIFTPNLNTVIKANTETNQMFSVANDYSRAYKFEYIFDDVKKID
ncbi:MAG: hypothetical protein ACI4VL_00165 [Bacilli bacterium]